MKKLNQQIKILFITAGLVLCSSVTALAASYEGQLDSVSDSMVTGWAKDTINPDNPVQVNIAIIPEGSTEPVIETTLLASDFRESGDYNPKSSGYCGFSWDVDWSELDNGTYQINLQTGTKRARKNLSYTNTSGKEAAAAPASAEHTVEGYRSLGVFKTTAYCPCYSCSEGWGRSTSTGARARATHTVAVDPRIIPYGSKLLIDGVVYTAEDCGGGVKGNHIDIFYDTHSETSQHGVRYKEVYLIQ